MSCPKTPIFTWTESQATTCSNSIQQYWMFIGVSILLVIAFMYHVSCTSKRKQKEKDQKHHQKKTDEFFHKHGIFICICIISLLFFAFVFNHSTKKDEWKQWQDIKAYFRSQGMTDVDTLKQTQALWQSKMMHDSVEHSGYIMGSRNFF